MRGRANTLIVFGVSYVRYFGKCSYKKSFILCRMCSGACFVRATFVFRFHVAVRSQKPSGLLETGSSRTATSTFTQLLSQGEKNT